MLLGQHQTCAPAGSGRLPARRDNRGSAALLPAPEASVRYRTDAVCAPRLLSKLGSCWYQYHLGGNRMKTACVIDGPHVGLAPKAPVSYLRSDAPRIAANATPLRLQHALARVEALERALASSQQESIAAQKQVEVLT